MFVSHFLIVNEYFEILIVRNCNVFFSPFSTPCFSIQERLKRLLLNTFYFILLEEGWGLFIFQSDDLDRANCESLKYCIRFATFQPFPWGLVAKRRVFTFSKFLFLAIVRSTLRLLFLELFGDGSLYVCGLPPRKSSGSYGCRLHRR